MTTVSFPGLGIGEFKINPVAFTIPIGDGIEVRWYGLLIVLGIMLAFAYCAYRSRQEGVSFDDLLDIAIFTIIFSIIGARLYYVLTSLDSYDSFLDVFKIWEGGIAIYGAIIAGAITIFTVCKVKKYSINKTLKFLDATALGVMLGQIIGRWGNFCNGEAFGEVVPQNSFLYFIRMGLNSGNTGYQTMFVHPTFLYESLWNLVGFIVIHFLYKKKKFDGQIVLMYLAWYGFGRMFIEGLRTDSLYVGSFRISQIVGFLCFVVFGALLVINLIRAYKKKPDENEYTPAFGGVSETEAESEDQKIVNNDNKEGEDEDGENN